MNRRGILGGIGAGSLAIIAGCTNEPGDSSDEQQSTESEPRGDSEKRADFLFNNKTPSVQQLTMTVTDDSETVVFQESYQLDPQGEKKTTIPELRDELYNYQFETDSSSATGRFGPDRPTQVRVKVRRGEINIFVVA